MPTNFYRLYFILSVTIGAYSTSYCAPEKIAFSIAQPKLTRNKPKHRFLGNPHGPRLSHEHYLQAVAYAKAFQEEIQAGALQESERQKNNATPSIDLTKYRLRPQ